MCTMIVERAEISGSGKGQKVHVVPQAEMTTALMEEGDKL